MFMQLHNSETLCVCVRACLHYMNGAKRRKLAGKILEQISCLQLLWQSMKGIKLWPWSKVQETLLYDVFASSGNDNSTIASLRLTDSP